MAARYYFGVVRLVPGKGFVATFPDLPEFTLSGNSVDEVKEACERALTPHLQSLSEQGKEIPLPKTEMYVSPYQELGEFRILISRDIPDEDPPSLILRNA
jgi:predicted RNase H-like HicB family nuclease